jgi:hypothetical protein
MTIFKITVTEPVHIRPDDGPIGPKHVALNVLLMVITDVLEWKYKYTLYEIWNTSGQMKVSHYLQLVSTWRLLFLSKPSCNALDRTGTLTSARQAPTLNMAGAVISNQLLQVNNCPHPPPPPYPGTTTNLKVSVNGIRHYKKCRGYWHWRATCQQIHK